MSSLDDLMKNPEPKPADPSSASAVPKPTDCTRCACEACTEARESLLARAGILHGKVISLEGKVEMLIKALGLSFH